MKVRRMKITAIIVLAAVTLTQSALAGDKSTDVAAKPSSFVPHTHSNTHVYGTPIQPAVVGHSRSSHHKHAPNKQSSPQKIKTVKTPR